MGHTQSTVSAEAYARWRATTLGGITERVESRVVLDLLGDPRGKRVLDVGTGDGAYAIEAAARGAIVTAVDLQPAMLDAARARAARRGVDATWLSADAERLPFGDASFDAVVAVTVLCFVADPARAVREMARVLVPGGRLVLGELGRRSLWAAERRLRGWLGAHTWRSARFWSRDDLERLARAAELRVSEVRGAVFFPPIGALARWMAPVDHRLGRLRVPGAAFLALAADRARVDVAP